MSQSEHAQSERTQSSFRKTLFIMLDGEKETRKLGKAFDIFLIILISTNVLAVILESVREIQESYEVLFRVFELFSVAVFTIEYLARLWVAVEDEEHGKNTPFKARLNYCLTPMAIIDLLSVLPFYLGFLFSIDLRFMRVLRLARIFKLTRYSSAMTMLMNVFRQEAQAFGAALFVLFILMIFAASMIYLFEHEAQPIAFADIPSAMWWAVITLSTVGYGDVYPITIMGKFFGAAISVIGIGMVALPAGILASGFSDQLHRSRSEFQHNVLNALEDGILTPEEIEQLSDLQEELGLSEDEAKYILQHVSHRKDTTITECPYCGETLTESD